MQPPRIIISGGGTGGHIFPAIAIAKAVQKLTPDAQILFVGAKGRMEMEKVPAAGYEIEGLWISGLQRKLTLKNLMFPFKVISSLMKARRIVRSFKPDVAVGVGGYASGPLLKAAASMGKNTLIQEQNSYPGITNKLLSKNADKICVAYDGMDRWFPSNKILKTGNPVREEVTQLDGIREEALAHFGLNPSKKTVLVVGGSLGARTINESIKKCLQDFVDQDIQLVWQCGKFYYEDCKEFASSYNQDLIKVHQFITTMNYAYAAADIIVSRAGAMSISELSLVKKPCILVPSPNVAEDHQTHNAMSLVNKGAAVLVKDVEARETLGKEILSLLSDEEKRSSLSANISLLGLAGASEQIAREVLALAETNKKN
jgi:UDP-N-acetylglucosamine--N-acetylmuramyl-(pentapeptide) pyrophosphoryl-undecaprenol N-acetylglucosamine transferase